MAAETPIYDYIVCGGGTSGCAIAARLAENPSIKVLVLEAGGPKESAPFSAIPAAVGQVLGTEADYQIWSEPNPALNDRRLHLGRGKLLGGTSGANGTLCIRGSKEDYDAWDIPGWSGDEIFRYMSKAETFKNKTWFKADEEAHGHAGPILTAPHDNAPISNLCLKSFQDMGLPFKPDMFTVGGIPNGCGHAVRTIYQGVRTTSADYIAGANQKPNIDIKTYCYVDKLILEGEQGSLKVIGVQGVTSSGEPFIVNIRKEVILSAGVYGSPAVLLRSGIGPMNEIEKHGIEHRLDLPGVGKNLMDHMVMLLFYEVSRAGLTNDHLIWHDGARDKSTAQYKDSRTGFMSQFPFGSFAFARIDSRLQDSALWQQSPRDPLLDPMGLSSTQPQIELWNTECYSPKYLYKDFPSDSQHAFALAVEFFSPQSRGSVTLQSKNPLENPIVDHKHLSNPLDMLVFSEACNYANEIVTRGAGTRDVVVGSWPAFLGYESFTKREQWEPILRARADTCYHPAGTCKMGRIDDGNPDPTVVVDPELRVRGVAGLRVADASVMPSLMTGHPQMACYGIGEKAADLIKAAA